MVPIKSPEIVLNVVLRPGEDGYTVAECLEISGCMSQGKTPDEAVENIVDAIQGCLAVMLEEAIKVGRPSAPNVVGTESQETFRVAAPELERIHA
jgi:predicted RNase H-like HicB family nuclease